MEGGVGPGMKEGRGRVPGVGPSVETGPPEVVKHLVQDTLKHLHLDAGGISLVQVKVGEERRPPLDEKEHDSVFFRSTTSFRTREPWETTGLCCDVHTSLPLSDVSASLEKMFYVLNVVYGKDSQKIRAPRRESTKFS